MNTPTIRVAGPLVEFVDFRNESDLSFESTDRSLYVRLWTGTLTDPVTVEMDLDDGQVAVLQHLLTDHLERNRP